MQLASVRHEVAVTLPARLVSLLSWVWTDISPPHSPGFTRAGEHHTLQSWCRE